VKHLALVAILAAGVVVAGPISPASAAVSTTVTVTGNAQVRVVGHFGSSAAGGFYSLYTYGGPQQNSFVDLVSGNANGVGDVDVTISSAIAQAATTSNQFELAIASLLPGSTTRARVAVIGIGLQFADVAAGVKVEWGSVPLAEVNVYDDPQDAILAVNGPHGPSSASSTSSSGSSCPDCVYVDSGDDPALLGPGDPSQDLHGYDMPGQRAFRGTSHRVKGATSRFEMHAADTQRWQNGYRYQAGPFAVQSHTDRTLGTSQDTFWPVRSDCWDPSLPHDGPNCTSNGQEGNADGRQKKFGNDTWRWAQGIHASCLPIPLLPCIEVYWTHESLFNKQYDGGTDSECAPDCAWDLTGYYKKPTEVRANTWGSWAQFTPGSSVGLFRTNDNSYGSGVTVDISFPESFGSTSFTSSTKHTKASKWGDWHWFRPTTDYTHFYKWYRYALGSTGYANEGWSCEFDDDRGTGNPGPPGGSCWNRGS